MKTEAFAKVNLTLEVFGTRPDGYHALRSVVMPVALADAVEIEEDLDLSCNSGFPDDLCLKAARVLRASVLPDGRTRGACIRVAKRIPVGGGLGGGSADAAATLLLLNDLWGLGLARPELAALGAQVGSDVPALVLAQGGGTPVLMEGRGEQVAPLAPPPEPLHLVLANPGVFSSTAAVYAKCRSRVTNDPSILYNMQTALASGDPERVAAALVNDLEAPAMALHPEIGAAQASLREAGALGVRMSGSGSTVFGLVRTEEEGRRVAAQLEAKGLKAWSVRTACPVV